tara:strand:+ start:10664 stop:11044 length:381 start_codon:yes stop_codon:yes gene_type:complete
MWNRRRTDNTNLNLNDYKMKNLTYAELNGAADFLVNYMQECKKHWDSLKDSGYEMNAVKELLERKETQADFLLGEINLEIFKKQGESGKICDQKSIDKILVDNLVNTLKLSLGSTSEGKLSLHTLA